MNKDDIIGLFNTKLKEFVDDLLLLYPEDGNLHAAKKAILLLKTIDGRKTLQLFKVHIYDRYSKQLYDRDETFFMTKDYEEETRLLENVAENITQQLVDNIKQYWTQMSDKNKDTVWKYWLILLKLCEKYFI
jgi:ribosomal protein S17E